ncbi:MAG: ABC transporter ATP-binding protein, partial [Myxococcales bacterium]|nr:ABC transporter ATP-binding protein [Myxococcales bacterium]
MSHLTLEDLTLTLPNGRQLFRNVSLSVSDGEVVAVLGRSGAGKSTLGDVLFGLLRERNPQVSAEARRLSANPSEMALVLQKGSLFDHLSTKGNIRFAARRRAGKSLTDEQIDALLDEVGMDTHDRPVASLSGGEERRVTVARALATEPKFIYFDEPGAGLDVSNVHRLGALIRKVCDTHRAGAIVVTHNPLLTALVADRVVYLNRQDGSLDDLTADWPGPARSDDLEGLISRRDRLERALLEQTDEIPRLAERRSAWIGRARERATAALAAPGRLLADLVRIIANLPKSLRHPRDFAQLGWYSLKLTGYSGVLFFALVAAIFSATFLSIAFAAAALISPDLVLENLRGDFILAMTPPLCGFLY